MLNGKSFKAEDALQSDSENPHSASHRFNKVLFGAGVRSQTDFIAQLSAISTACLVNLAIVFIVIAAAASVLGYFDPFHVPLEQSGFVPLLVLSNLVAFVLTYVASLEWTLHDDAVQRQRPRKRGRPAFYIFFLLLSLGSIFFLAATYVAFSFVLLLASIMTNSALIQLLVSERAKF